MNPSTTNRRPSRFLLAAAIGLAPAATLLAGMGSTYNWLNASGGNWLDENWDFSGVPGFQDTARFALDTAGYTVTFSGSADAHSLLVPQDRVEFDLTGATLALLSDSTFSEPSMQIGALNGTTRSVVSLSGAGRAEARTVLIGSDSSLTLLGTAQLQALSIEVGPEFIFAGQFGAEPVPLAQGRGTTTTLDVGVGATAAATSVGVYSSGEVNVGAITLAPGSGLQPEIPPLRGTLPAGLVADSLFVDEGASLDSAGDFTMQAGATLRMVVGPATSDPVMVGGALVLDGGALVIENTSGFDPPAGTVINLIAANGVTGVFNLVAAPAFPDDRFYEVVLSATGVDLVVSTLGDFGSFGPEENEGLPSLPRAIAVADFNADGFPDPAVAISNPDDNIDGSVIVLANAGNDTNGDWLGFTGMSTQVFVGRRPTGIASADFDLDGSPDLAVCNFLDDDVHVLINLTAALAPTFSFDAPIIIETESGPAAIAAFRVDEDALPDIVTANTNADSATFALNQFSVAADGPAARGGAFGTPTSRPAGRRPVAVDPADIDNDKDLDVLVTNDEREDDGLARGTPVEGAVRVLINQGIGITSDGGGIPVGLDPLDTTIADLNNDGFPDIVTANSSDGTLSISLHSGEGGLQRGLSGAGLYLPAVAVPAGDSPRSVTKLDLNADGFLDLAVATSEGGSNFIRLLRNDFLEQGGQITLSDAQDVMPSGAPQVVAAGDMNADGTLDLLSLNDNGVGGVMRGGLGMDASISVFINLNRGEPALPSCVESMADNDTVETCQIVDAEECGGLITGKLEARDYAACQPDTYLVLFDKQGAMIAQDDNGSTKGNGWASGLFDVDDASGIIPNGDGTHSIRIGVTGRPDGFDGKFNGLFMNAPHGQRGGFCLCVTYKDDRGVPLLNPVLPDGTMVPNPQVYCDEFVSGAEAFRINYTLPVGTVFVDVEVDNVVGTRVVGGDVDFYCVEGLIPLCDYCVVQVGGLTDDCTPTCTAIGWVDKDGMVIDVAEGGGLIPEYTTLCPIVADHVGRAVIVVSGAGDKDFDGLLDAAQRAPAECPEAPPFHEKIGCYTIIFEVLGDHGGGDGQSGDEVAAMEAAMRHGDINMDGVTNTADLGLLLGWFGWFAE